jgi:hypothetical protein
MSQDIRMKHSILLLILFLTGSQITLAKENPVDTPEKLVKQLIECLHSNSADSFIASRVACSPETKNAELQKKETPIEATNKCTQKLRAIRESLNMLKAIIKKTEPDKSRWIAVDIKTHLKTKRGYQKTDIYFTIQDDADFLWIKMDDCFQVNENWYMTEPIKFNTINKP